MRVEFEVDTFNERMMKRVIEKMSVLADRIELHYCESEKDGEKLWVMINGRSYVPVVQDYLKWIGVLGTDFILK